MREQLTQYVNLLFAGRHDVDEMRAEILQNTLDRYDDLLDEGKTPEAAYRLAIAGIGDINEILGDKPQNTVKQSQADHHQSQTEPEEDIKNKKLRAAGIAMYIVCAIPLFILSDLGLETIGLTLTILLIACATFLMIITGKKDNNDDSEKTTFTHQKSSPHTKLKKSIESLIWAIGLAVYFFLSFATKAWYITWILFPVIGCINGLMNAILDLKEAIKYEN